MRNSDKTVKNLSLTDEIFEALETESCKEGSHEDIGKEGGILEELPGATQTSLRHEKIIQIGGIHLKTVKLIS